MKKYLIFLAIFLTGICLAQQPDPDTPFVPYMGGPDSEAIALPVAKDIVVVEDGDIEEVEIEGICIKRVSVKKWSHFSSFCKYPDKSEIIKRDEKEAELIYLPPGCHMIRLINNKFGYTADIEHYHDDKCFFEFINKSSGLGQVPDKSI